MRKLIWIFGIVFVVLLAASSYSFKSEFYGVCGNITQNGICSGGCNSTCTIPVSMRMNSTNQTTILHNGGVICYQGEGNGDVTKLIGCEHSVGNPPCTGIALNRTKPDGNLLWVWNDEQGNLLEFEKPGRGNPVKNSTITTQGINNYTGIDTIDGSKWYFLSNLTRTITTLNANLTFIDSCKIPSGYNDSDYLDDFSIIVEDNQVAGYAISIGSTRTSWVLFVDSSCNYQRRTEVKQGFESQFVYGTGFAISTFNNRSFWATEGINYYNITNDTAKFTIFGTPINDTEINPLERLKVNLSLQSTCNPNDAVLSTNVSGIWVNTSLLINSTNFPIDNEKQVSSLLLANNTYCSMVAGFYWIVNNSQGRTNISPINTTLYLPQLLQRQSNKSISISCNIDGPNNLTYTLSDNTAWVNFSVNMTQSSNGSAVSCPYDGWGMEFLNITNLTGGWCKVHVLNRVYTGNNTFKIFKNLGLSSFDTSTGPGNLPVAIAAGSIAAMVVYTYIRRNRRNQEE